MKILILLLFTLVALAAGPLAGCDNRGPVEKAGERIDDAGKAVRDAVKK